MGRKRWWGHELASLRADYENPRILMRVIAEKHGTSLGQMARLARIYKWQPRRISASNPKLSCMRARLRILRARIEKTSLEVRRLESKIKFLETINGDSREM